MAEHLSATVRRYSAARFDYRAAVFLALFSVVIFGGLQLRPILVSTGTAQSAVTGTSTGQQASVGIMWAVAEALFAAALLGMLVLWRRLPDWVQSLAGDALMIAIWMLVGARALATEQFHLVLPAVIGLFALAKVADEFDVWWVLNNILAICLAIYLAASVGVILGPIIIAVGLVGLSVYDHAFANKRDWMFDLAAWTIRRKLPMLIVIPSSWRHPWAELAEEADEPRDDVFGIGMADLLLPAAFAVALAHTGRIGPLAGAIAGTLVACFRLSWRVEHAGSGAGLPPLTAGALGGGIVGMVVA